jgi:hypothetical protein
MAGAGRTAALLTAALMLAACNTHTPAPAYSPTPAPTGPITPRSEPADVVAFRDQRNAICRKAGQEVAAASVPAGGSFEETAAVARRVADLTEATQERLERLDSPRSLKRFTATDAARRRSRVRLLRQLAEAILASGDADALTASIAESSAAAQAAENKHRLVNCP